MNGLELAIKALTLIVQLTPEKHPPVDYSEFGKAYAEYYDKHIHLLDSAPKFGEGFVIQQSPVSVSVVESPSPPLALPSGEKRPVSTSCIACSRSHLSTIAGALDESLRFAREGGITDPEVIRRLDIAEREINMLERIDLSAESIQNSEEKDQILARQMLPKIRKLRQEIGQISDVNKLEATAAEASILTHEFRLAHMQSQGADLNPIIALAKRVENGEIDLETARQMVKQYLPAGA